MSFSRSSLFHKKTRVCVRYFVNGCLLIELRANFSAFLQFSSSNFRSKHYQWGDLDLKKCLQREPFTKYLRQTLVFL